MAKETKTNSVEKTAPLAGKAVTERLSAQLTGVHSTFSLLLDEIKTNNKISNGLTLDQLKLEKKGDKDTEDNKEQFDKVIVGLKEINDTLKSIKKSSTGGKVSGSPVEGKESLVSKGLPGKAENLTFTEKLKTVVGGVKSAGNKFMETGGNVVGAVTDTLTDPGAAIKKAYGSAGELKKKVKDTAKDILSTKADYSVEQERFATAYSKTGRGGLMQGKKTGKEVGAEVFNKLKVKQEEVDKQKAVLKPFGEQGFAPIGEKKKLAKLQKELADMDPRVQKEEKKEKAEQVVEKKQEAKTRIDKEEKKKDKTEVKAEKSSRKKASVESKVSSKAEQDPSKVSAPSGSEDLLKEIQANNVTLSSLLSVTQTQLISINAIKEALAPSTPKELTEQKSAPSSTNEKESGGGSLIGDLASAAGGLIGGGKGKAGKAGKGIGGKMLSGLGKAAKFLGPAAAIAGAAYSGFEGYQNTNENFDLKEGEDATVGQKTASTLGGVASGLTFGLLDEKTAAQGIHKAGAAVGDAASAAGNFVSDKAKSIGSSVSGFFGGIGDKVKGVYNGGIGLNDQAKGVAQADQAVSTNTVSNTSEVSGQGLTTTKSDLKQGVTAEKSVLGSTFLGGLFTAKGKTSGNFLGTSSEETTLQGKVEGKQIDSTDSKTGETFGKRISGGLFGADTYKVTNKAGEEQEVSKMEYNKLQGLAKEGKVDEVHASLDKMAAAKKAALEPSGIDAMGNVTGTIPTATGKDIIQASTENKDMEREAGNKGGGNNTVVSNNVSSNNTTKFVPMKANPRPEYTGSSLDRYTSRITVY